MTMFSKGKTYPKSTPKHRGVNSGLMPTTSPEGVRKSTASQNKKGLSTPKAR